MNKILLSLAVLFMTSLAYSTHIVGGEVTYEHLGGASYKLTVNLYRDCDPASVDFSANQTVRIDQGDGTFYMDITLPMLSRDTLNPPLDTCAIDPGICVEEAIYSKIINLPPGANGYHVYCQICCRNGSILNIQNPLNMLETFYTYVPDNNVYLTNSSPVISNFPPVFVCNQQDLSLDFGATDADGDSLVYSFYTPHNGANTNYYDEINYVAGTPPNNWQSSDVVWLPGFSATSPLDNMGGPGLNINPNTGFMTGSPVAVGQYVVGVQIDEYRNGVLIGRITRDFQFNVVNCPPPQQAGIGPMNGCAGTSIQMNNTSGAGANGFVWDFGDGSPTSTAFEPTHAYPGLGTYNVVLTAQAGTACADTAYYTLIVSGMTPANSFPDPVCVGETFTCTDLTTTLTGNVNAWEWDFGDGTTSNLQNPTHAYSSSGTYNIQMIVHSDVGCTDTLTKSIQVTTPPQAGIVPLNGCNGLTVNFTSNSDPGASGFWWEFGTGFPADTANTQNSSFTYSSYGTYNVSLVTQHGTACADTATISVMLTEFVPDFDMPDTMCTNTLINFTDLTTVSNGSVNSWAWDFGDGGNSTAQNPQHGYSSSGDYNVQLTAGSSLGCTGTITKPIHIKDAPVAQIGTVDACSGLDITFSNQSDPTASDFHWEFGTGNPADTSNLFEPTFTYGSFGSYTVTLYAQYGTGCQSSDTYVLNISELTADFSMVDTACANTTVTFTDNSVAAATLTQWEWDFGDGSTSLNQNDFHTYPNGGDYDVQLVVHTSVGCTDTIIKSLHIQGEITVDSGADTAVCVASPTLQLNGVINNAFGGVWSTSGSGVFTLSNTQLNATYNPSLPDINNGSVELYLQSIGNGYCSATTDTIVVTYLADPVVDAGVDIQVCADSAYQEVFGVAQNAVGTVWSTGGTGTFGDVNSDTTTYTPTVSDVAADSVLLYLTTVNNSGCPNATDSVTIYFNPAPTVNVTTVDTTCAGYDVVINSNSSTNNGWWEDITGDGTFTPDTASTTVFVTGPADVTNGFVDIVFHSLDNGGCKVVNDTTHIDIIPSPIVDFSTTEVCQGDQNSFTDLTTSVDQITDWNWTFETGQTSTVQNPNYTFSQAGTHDVTLIVTSQNGCLDTLTKPIDVHYLPAINFSIPEPCLYGATFVDSTTVQDTTLVSWSWNFGDGATSTEQNPLHQYSSAGNYDITLTVVSAYGCSNFLTINQEIYPAPVADFTNNPEYAEVDEEIIFTDLSTSSNSTVVAWHWDFDFNGDTSIIQNPTHPYDDAGAFEVELIVMDAVGCKDTVVKVVNVLYGPDVPTAFSPNGDNNNDYIMVLGGIFESIDFTIYNNWGEIVFNTTDINSPGWDGKLKGEDQPIGVYVYKAKVVTADGQEYEISGDISLIR